MDPLHKIPSQITPSEYYEGNTNPINQILNMVLPPKNKVFNKMEK